MYKCWDQHLMIGTWKATGTQQLRWNITDLDIAKNKFRKWD